MADPTTHLIEAGSPAPPTAVAVNGAAVRDVRTLRQVARAEQERLSADAEVERRARAAHLDQELREQRRAAARRDRATAVADKQARIEQRRIRRTARRAALLAAAPRWADRALFVLPIMFPMAVAWVGQIRFAMTVMAWPLPAAIVFAAGFELSTAYVARLDWLSRAAGDSALLFRAATWGFAAGAATMNYWHAAGPGFTPTGEAVSYGLMSITGVVLWELLSTYRHRTSLRTQGKLPAARPRFGLARWIWFSRLTRIAWLLTLRDGHPTTDEAWQAALRTVDHYGSPKAARRAVRVGCAVPPPAHPTDHDPADTPATADPRDTGNRTEPLGVQTRTDHRDIANDRTDRDHHDGDDARDALARPPDQRDEPEQGPEATARTAVDDEIAPVVAASIAVPDTASRQQAATDQHRAGGDRHRRRDRPGGTAGDDRGPTARPQAPARRPARARTNPSNTGTGRRVRNGPGEQALAATMLNYAREHMARGVTVTGADLDREFGTRDYGRKVLRRLAQDIQPVAV